MTADAIDNRVPPEGSDTHVRQYEACAQFVMGGESYVLCRLCTATQARRFTELLSIALTGGDRGLVPFSQALGTKAPRFRGGAWRPAKANGT